MDVNTRLLWIHLTTANIKNADCWIQEHQVELLPQFEPYVSYPSRQPLPHEAPQRWSPIYLIGEPTAICPFDSKIDGILWLLFDTKPVELAAHLDKHISPGIPHGIFLTHGMASVLLLLQPQASHINPVSLFPDRQSLRAVERWSVAGGHITEHTVIKDAVGGNLTLEPSASSHYKAHVSGAFFRHLLDNDLLKEQVASLCGHYRPSYEKGVKDVLQRSDMMLQVIKPGAPDHSARWEHLQSRAYQLIHLNSMCAYFLSQGLGGNPPLLAYQGLLPSYSLFGVATAYQAIWNLTHFIENAFLRFDILTEMKDRYFTKQSTDYHTDCFKPELDEMRAAQNGSKAKVPGHLNLFSGRLGFHSSTWAVAAPVDVLHQAAVPGWNLLTLSHEMLHVHVDSLLHFVLSPTPTKEKLSQDDLYMKMAALAKENASRQDLPIIDRLRQKIARYVLQSAASRGGDDMPLSHLPRSKNIKLAEISNSNQFRDMVVTFYRRLSEYVVHVLDFNYFYAGNVNRFLDLVIGSWASIPSVYDDIGHYIMRCLIALSTREMDPDTAVTLVEPLSFDRSLQTFTDGLAKLAAVPGTSDLVARIQQFLAQEEEKEFLRLEYDRAKSLAWMTVMYFYCRPLRLFLEVGRDVEGGLIDETTLCPDFELGSVQEGLPASPIAFLWKYLAKEYAQPDDGLEISPEATSLWLFSWLASSGPKEGGPHVA